MPQKVHCNICNGNVTKLIQDTNVVLGPVKIEMLRCAGCGLVYLNPQPTNKEIEELYSDEYFINWYSSEEKRQFSENYFRNLLKTYNLLEGSIGNLLDIGSGMGFFLKVAREYKWDVKGVEISPYASQHCRDKLGLDVQTGRLDETSFENDFFDLITAFDVIEHLTDLAGFISSVRRVLKKEGRFIVIVPNYNGLVFQLDRVLCKAKHSPLPNIPEHLSYFTFDTLTRLFENNNFKIEKILSVDANDDGSYMDAGEDLMGRIRSVLNNLSFNLGKVLGRREAILAVAKKTD